MKNSPNDKLKKSIKLGDAFKLGEHLLVCGDACDELSVKKVVSENKVRLVLTDPPYGVAYVENKDWLGLRGSQAEHSVKFKKIENDHLQTDEEYLDFSKKWLEKVIPYLADKNAFYIFNCDLMFCALRQAMRDIGIYYSQMVIWLKDHIVLGRKDYNPQHELIAYGWYGRHKFERSKDKSVVVHPKPHRSKLHPTMKPVGLLRKLILNSTRINEYVYDPFGGSGSTMIACEQVKRRCLMIELDPEYCLVIINRWENLTGMTVEQI